MAEENDEKIVFFLFENKEVNGRRVFAISFLLDSRAVFASCGRAIKWSNDALRCCPVIHCHSDE